MIMITVIIIKNDSISDEMIDAISKSFWQLLEIGIIADKSSTARESKDYTRNRAVLDSFRFGLLESQAPRSHLLDHTINQINWNLI